jgi:hypothetical protein
MDLEGYILLRMDKAPECPSEYGRTHLKSNEFFWHVHGCLESVFHTEESLTELREFRDNLVTYVQDVREQDPEALSPSVHRYYEDRVSDIHRIVFDVSNGVILPFVCGDYQRALSPWDIPRRRTGLQYQIERLRRRQPASERIADVTESRGTALLTGIFGMNSVWNNQHFPSDIEVVNFTLATETQRNRILEIYEVPKGRAAVRARQLLDRYGELLHHCVTSDDSDDGESARWGMDQIFELLWSFPCGNPQFFTEREFPHCRELLSHLWYGITILRLSKCAMRGLERKLYVPMALHERTRGSTQHWVRHPDCAMDGGPNLQLDHITIMIYSHFDDDFFRWTRTPYGAYEINHGHKLEALGTKRVRSDGSELSGDDDDDDSSRPSQIRRLE